MTSKDLSIFNSLRPFSIGFDDMFDQFENMLGNGGLTMQSNYPPYNIRKTGKDNYAIEVALAGFNKDDVEVEFEDNLLTVRTRQVNKSENNNEDGENLAVNKATRLATTPHITVIRDKIDARSIHDQLDANQNANRIALGQQGADPRGKHHDRQHHEVHDADFKHY